MAGNDYLIPFGVDANKFFGGMQQIDATVDDMASNVVDANREMQKGFDESAKAGDKLDNSLKANLKDSAALSLQARQLGKDLGEALKTGKAGADLEKKLQNFSTLLGKFSTQANRKINFNIDTAKLEQFERMLTEGADGLKVLAEVSAYAKQQLAELDPNSEEFAALAAQIEIADSFLKGLNETTDEAEKKNVSLKTRLRELKAALAEMELAGQDNTEQFEQMSIEAGQLEDQIGDISARIRVLASDTKYIDAGVQAITALAGGFAVAQGAAALFGAESEEVNEAIKKVSAAMAILQGIQAVSNALNKDSALSVLLFSKAQKTATVSTVAQGVATTTTTAATAAATTGFKAFTAALLANPIFLVIAGIVALVSALAFFSSGQAEAAKATEELNRALERQSNLLEADEADLRRRTDLDVARAKAAEASESTITGIQISAAQERFKIQQDALQESRALYDKYVRDGNINADLEKQLSDRIRQQEEDLADTRNDIRIKGIEQQKQRQDEQDELDKKAIEAAKKRNEELKRILEQRIKFTNDLANAEIDAMEEGFEKERAQVRQRFKERFDELSRETDLSKEASALRISLINQLAENERIELEKINKKQAAERAALELQAQKLVADLMTEGIGKELENIRLNFQERRKEIETQYKDDIVTRRRLIRLLNQAEADEVKKVQDEAAKKQLAEREEREVLELEIAARFIGGNAKVEQQKQIAILEVKLKYAKEALELLISQGNAENSIVVLQAKKLIQDLTKALEVAVKENEGKGFDLFEFLGLGSLTNEQRAAVEAAIKESLKSITEITDFIVGQYQRQIDKRQEVIDQIDESINNLEEQLQREKELQEEGLANNVGLIEQEIEAKKAAREDELKQQEELQRRQRNIQRAQLVLDTVTQTSNLITSATQIFKALSGIPFIGIPLAIATIALMTGAFITTKAKAFQLVNEGGQQFGGGGWVDGKPHSAGGQKYVSADGTGGVVELEGGEHVTRKDKAAKYANLLDAINADKLPGMDERALRDMFADMGINWGSDTGKQALQVSRDRDELKNAVFIAGGSEGAEELAEISTNVKYLADRKRGDAQHWEDENNYYEKVGNTTTKTKKTK